jgi:hypothetical protein
MDGVNARTALITGFRLSLAGRSPARSAGMTGKDVADLMKRKARIGSSSYDLWMELV